MRNIKFRVYDINENVMDVVGAIDWGKDENIICCNGEKGKYYFGYDIELDPKLMQYTGLKDTSDKEIYEGDILETYSKKNIVKYIEGCFRLVGLHEDLYERNYELLQSYLVDATLRNMKSNFDGVTTTLKVIGNIYQNRELLGNHN